MEAVVRIESVREHQTRSGNTRYVVRDADRREYTTCRPAIGSQAKTLEGAAARIEWHEEERGGFRNVYLDKVEPAADAEAGTADGLAAHPDEAAWRTAVEAAPWLLGDAEPGDPVKPEELYDRLEPFKKLVAEDIRSGDSDDDE